jgi:hypothetical protein
MKTPLKSSCSAEGLGRQAALCLMAATLLLGGCESLQRKFVRKSKRPTERLSPVIAFQDYSRTMTPLDRYRKHFLMFDYWNGDLVAALQDTRPNPKRLRRSSSEALMELQTLQQLLNEEKGAALTSLIEARARIDRQLQHPSLNLGLASTLARQLEAQDRAIRREFFWREAQDHLRPEAAAAEALAPEETPSAGE